MVRKGPLVAALVAVAVVVVGAWGGLLTTGTRPALGLDLQGGISVILTPVVTPGQPIDSEVLDRTIDVIRDRVDSLGVAEPEISRQGDDVLVQLPGLRDEEQALAIIGRTAKLTFRPVLEVIYPGDPAYDEEGPDCASPEARLEELADEAEGVLCGAARDAVAPPPGTGTEPIPMTLKYRVGPAVIGGDRITEARAEPEPTGTGGFTNVWHTAVGFDREGGQSFADLTARLACERDQGHPGEGRIAIVLDNIVENAPPPAREVACGVGITGGSAVIQVGGLRADAEALALVLRTGALPITLEPSTVQTVSPTLGAESLRAGLLAGLIGLGLVAVYLIAFYRWLGVVAIGSLLLFGTLMYGLISLLGFAGFRLTLAGIAGVIVSIGITADSSIIYFERIRDEVGSGRTVRSGVQRAFTSAFRTNLTGNTVTFTAAVILYFLAVGPVRGFAFTLGLATVLDLIIMYVYTRSAVWLLGSSRHLTPASVRVEREVAVPVGGSR